MQDELVFRYPWQATYLDALIETNAAELARKISHARNVIADRLQVVGLSVEEQIELEDSMHILRFLLHECAEEQKS